MARKAEKDEAAEQALVDATNTLVKQGSTVTRSLSITHNHEW
jgi:hypothetical protein